MSVPLDENGVPMKPVPPPICVVMEGLTTPLPPHQVPTTFLGRVKWTLGLIKPEKYEPYPSARSVPHRGAQAASE